MCTWLIKNHIRHVHVYSEASVLATKYWYMARRDVHVHGVHVYCCTYVPCRSLHIQLCMCDVATTCIYTCISLQIFFLVTLVIPDELIKDSLHYVFLLNPAYTLVLGPYVALHVGMLHTCLQWCIHVYLPCNCSCNLYRLGIGLNDVYINHFLRSICTFTPLAREWVVSMS